jgi:glutamyl-tRNA reductase
MPVVVLGLSHRTSPVELRERFAFSEAAIPETLAQLRTSGLAEEGVIVSTCNRVELYAAVARADREAMDGLRHFLLRASRHEGPVKDELYALAEPQSLEHLFKVASGLDSMVLGETEILGQLKKAYDLALQHRHTGRRLNKTFQRAFNVAKQIRTETNIQRGSISVGSVAVDLAEKIFSSLTDHTVLVIGAGDTSEKAARALLSRGAAGVIVTNRSFDRAASLAQELGGKAIPFDDWAGEFGRIDIAISSTSAPHYVLDRPRLEPLMRLRRHRPLLLIDIAVPRDIDPEVNLMDDVFLYNIDDLQAIAEGALRQRQEEIAHCNEIIRDRVRGLLSPAAQASPASAPLAYEPEPGAS